MERLEDRRLLSIVDFLPGELSSSPRFITVGDDGNAYYWANSAESRNNIVITDGTMEGTRAVKPPEEMGSMVMISESEGLFWRTNDTIYTLPWDGTEFRTFNFNDTLQGSWIYRNVAGASICNFSNCLQFPAKTEFVAVRSDNLFTGEARYSFSTGEKITDVDYPNPNGVRVHELDGEFYFTSRFDDGIWEETGLRIGSGKFIQELGIVIHPNGGGIYSVSERMSWGMPRPDKIVEVKPLTDEILIVLGSPNDEVGTEPYLYHHDVGFVQHPQWKDRAGAAWHDANLNKVDYLTTGIEDTAVVQFNVPQEGIFEKWVVNYSEGVEYPFEIQEPFVLFEVEDLQPEPIHYPNNVSTVHDRIFWIKTTEETNTEIYSCPLLRADRNFDCNVNSGDLVVLFQKEGHLYEEDVDSIFADLNGDNRFSTGDLVVLFQEKT